MHDIYYVYTGDQHWIYQTYQIKLMLIVIFLVFGLRNKSKTDAFVLLALPPCKKKTKQKQKQGKTIIDSLVIYNDYEPWYCQSTVQHECMISNY